MILALFGLALAAPDRVAFTYAVGPEVTDVVATADGAFVGWTDAGNGGLTVLDTAAFDPVVVAACPGARGLAVTGDATTDYTFYVGCSDGSVVSVAVSADGDVGSAEAAFALGDGPVQGLETDGTTLWGILEEDEQLVAYAVTVEDGEPVSGFGSTLQSATFEDTTLTTDSVIVVHGGDEVSKISRTAGTAILPQSSLGRTLVDAAYYSAGNAVYLADDGGGLVRFESDNDYVALIVGGETTTAVGLHPDEGWMLLGAGEDALLYDFDAGAISEAGTVEGAANVHEIAVVDGYAFGATEDGSVHVLTDRPWVTIESLSQGEAIDGDEVTLRFRSDTAGTYTVYAGGTAEDLGKDIGSGDIDAGASADVTFTVNAADFEEGANRIWVFVNDGALEGRAAGMLTVDNPPGAVQLGQAGVGFGNGSIHVEFGALADADIEEYRIFIDVEPFSAADYPTGGPEFGGDDDIDAPIVVTATSGDRVSRTITPLTNGTTYYVAVRAYDAKFEGPMSDVQSAMPEQTYCATCLAGDDSGYFPGLCGVTGSGSAGLAGVVLAGAALLRRRRVAAAAVGLLAVGLVPSTARAATDDDEGPRTMNVQLRYGPTTIAEPYINQIFGHKPHEILWFEYGYASRFVDANLGVGFFQELGFLQTADGRVSDEHDMFTMIPLALTVTGRLDLLDEQPIVPFARVGLDYWMWRENWYVADPDSTVSERVGGKYGWHYGGGLLILLDVLDRRAASRLEAISGINDTFLVAEYRKTNLVHGDDQVNLSSEEVTFGLKFDF